MAIKVASERGRKGAKARWSKATRPKKKAATNWKRAIRIAHDVIESDQKHPNNWSYEFKQKLQEQHIALRERGPRGKTLFPDALDYTIEQRKRRKD